MAVADAGYGDDTAFRLELPPGSGSPIVLAVKGAAASAYAGGAEPVTRPPERRARPPARAAADQPAGEPAPARDATPAPVQPVTWRRGTKDTKATPLPR